MTLTRMTTQVGACVRVGGSREVHIVRGAALAGALAGLGVSAEDTAVLTDPANFKVHSVRQLH